MTGVEDDATVFATHLRPVANTRGTHLREDDATVFATCSESKLGLVCALAVQILRCFHAPFGLMDYMPNREIDRLT